VLSALSVSVLSIAGLIGLSCAVLAWFLLRRARREELQSVVTPEPAPAQLLRESAVGQPPDAAREVAAHLHELGFGVPPTAPSSDSAHTEIAAEIRATLSQPVLKPEYAPRRPLLLPKLLQAVNDPEASGRELSMLISKDPALTATLLRMANSALYRIDSRPVESIDRAVALLGTTGIRSVIAAALMQPVFRTSSAEFKRFPEVTWEHTQYAGSAAEAHAAIISNSDPFAAQLLALLFGLGTILTFRAALDQYARNGLPPDATTVALLIDQNNASVAQRTAHDWGLSERILSALEEQSPQVAAQSLSPLGQSLRFGRYCGAIALLHAKRVFDEPTALSALRAEGFGIPACERIWTRLNKQAVGV
jgi:HD-like signal output (HDOD) protein